MNVTVSVNATLAQICILCKIAYQADSTGCYGKAYQHSNINSTVTFEVIRVDGASLASECACNLSYGVYDIVVFDLDINGIASNLPSFAYHNISLPRIGRSQKLA